MIKSIKSILNLATNGIEKVGNSASSYLDVAASHADHWKKEQAYNQAMECREFALDLSKRAQKLKEELAKVDADVVSEVSKLMAEVNAKLVK